MTQQEQDAVVGKLVRERFRTLFDIAILEAKHDTWQAPFSAMLKAIRESNLPEAQNLLDQLPPDWNTIRDSFEDLIRLKENLKEFDRRLKPFTI